MYILTLLRFSTVVFHTKSSKMCLWICLWVSCVSSVSCWDTERSRERGWGFHFYLSHSPVRSHTAFNHFSPQHHLSLNLLCGCVSPPLQQIVTEFISSAKPPWSASCTVTLHLTALLFFLSELQQLLKPRSALSSQPCGCQHFHLSLCGHFWTWRTEIRT